MTGDISVSRITLLHFVAKFIISSSFKQFFRHSQVPTLSSCTGDSFLFGTYLNAHTFLALSVYSSVLSRSNFNSQKKEGFSWGLKVFTSTESSTKQNQRQIYFCDIIKSQIFMSAREYCKTSTAKKMSKKWRILFFGLFNFYFLFVWHSIWFLFVGVKKRKFFLIIKLVTFPLPMQKQNDNKNSFLKITNTKFFEDILQTFHLIN